mmetsp:Transcript_26757/g.89589  ORF Transcript_26757/g.89589 Transcript_26757/m.89589 type:complete len:232 (-) Transcript_26757:270-965(-)
MLPRKRHRHQPPRARAKRPARVPFLQKPQRRWKPRAATRTIRRSSSSRGRASIANIASWAPAPRARSPRLLWAGARGELRPPTSISRPPSRRRRASRSRCPRRPFRSTLPPDPSILRAPRIRRTSRSTVSARCVPSCSARQRRCAPREVWGLSASPSWSSNARGRHARSRLLRGTSTTSLCHRPIRSERTSSLRRRQHRLRPARPVTMATNPTPGQRAPQSRPSPWCASRA